MPLKSKAQKKLMQAVANDSKFAKEVEIPQSVAKEYVASTPKEMFKKLRDRVKKK